MSTSIVDAEGHDAGLRFVDIDEDGYDDIMFSNETVCGLIFRTRRRRAGRRMWLTGGRGDAGTFR